MCPVVLTLLSLLLTGDVETKVKQIPQFISVMEGQHVTINCILEGDFDLFLEFVWKLNNTRIKPKPSGPQINHGSDQMSSSLTITFVTAQDSGLYQCSLRRLYPEPQTVYTANGTYVVIAGKAAIRVLQSPPSLNLKKSQTARLSCMIEGAHQWMAWDYEWTLNDSRTISSLKKQPRASITEERSSSLLSISSVTPKDSGLYVCSVWVRYPTSERYTGNGSGLVITVAPTITVKTEAVSAEKPLLVCRAERFHPQELNITWSFSLMGLQTQENLTEDEDGTYTKTSSVEITEELRGRGTNGVTCYVQHIALAEPLSGVVNVSARNVSDTGVSLYLYLFPVRILLVIIPIMYLIVFRMFFHNR